MEVVDVLDVLPSQNELAGLAPAAWVSGRRRVSPAFNARFARLEARIAGLVNDFAKVRGQTGAQTEPDVERAYQSLVDTQSRIFGGDTRESARNRLAESLRLVTNVLASLPPEPEGRGPAAAPEGRGSAGAPAVMRDGILYDADGNRIGVP